jgi:HKD family nuclease
MKLMSNIKDIILVDNEPVVGALVKSQKDENSTGMIVQFLSKDNVMILWSTPPNLVSKDNREIW